MHTHFVPSNSRCLSALQAVHASIVTPEQVLLFKLNENIFNQVLWHNPHSSELPSSKYFSRQTQVVPYNCLCLSTLQAVHWSAEEEHDELICNLKEIFKFLPRIMAGRAFFYIRVCFIIFSHANTVSPW